MDIEDEEAAITVGISIPLDPSKGLQTHLLETKSLSSVFPNYPAETSQFCNLPISLDPNFGIMGKIPSSNILHENSTFNCWNIEPHFMHSLPLSTCSCETSILIFGGLNPSLALRRNTVDFDLDDFVLGSSIFQYLLNSRIWKYYGTMIEPRCYHACVLDADKQFVYVTGGYSLLKREHGEMLAVSSTDRLSLNNKQWKRCANMVTARASHAIASHKSFLFVFGGRCSQGKILSSVEIYNPDQDTWTLFTSTPQPAMGLCATCTSDSIWIFGGITSDSSGKPLKHLLQNVYSFNPSLKRWYEEPSLPFACAFSSCVSSEHSLWLVGGCTFSKNLKNDDTFVSCSSVLQLPLSVKHPEWKSVASLSFPRHALTAVLHEECIYILGGMESTNKNASSAVEVINTITNTNAVCRNIPVPVAGCTSIIINGNFSEHQCIECNKSYSQETLNETLDFSFKENSIQTNERPESFTILENISETEEKDVSFLNSDKNQLDSKKYSIEAANETISTENIEKENLYNEFQEKNLLNTYFEIDNERTDDLHNLQYRTSMEIFLNKNSNLENIAPSSSTLSKKSSSSKWLKFFNLLSVSDEELHKEVFESTDRKLSVRTKVDCIDSHNASEESSEVMYFGKLSDLEKLSNLNSNSNLVDSACNTKPLGQQSFMYVQSSLKSSLDLKSNEKNLEDKYHIENFDNISTLNTQTKMDDLDVPFEIGKIDITEESFPIILVMGGEYPTDIIKSKYILMYNCYENVWKYVGFLPDYRCHHSIMYVNNKIFIIGGYDALTSRLYDTISSKTLCYNIYTEMWYHTASMRCSRAYHSTALLGNEIFVLGGRDELGNILSSVELYNELNNEWRDCKPLPYPVLGAAATVLNGVVYVLGGITYKEENEIISSSTSIYDPQTSSWSLGPELPIPLAFCGVSTFSNSVWIFGGLTEDDENVVSGKDIFKFDISSNTWSKVSKLSVPRHASVTVSLGSNAYVIGGHSTQDKKEVVICELVDMSKNEVSTKKKLPIAVSGRAGILITELNKNNTEI